jgi:hypothetical protein
MIGVLGASPVIDTLVKSGKLKVESLAGQWEGFQQVVVDQPTAGVARALVIVGADRRGAVFGTYDLSERIGRFAMVVEAVKNNAHTVEARFEGVAAGRRVVKVWRLDDNVVLEKLIVEPG